VDRQNVMIRVLEDRDRVDSSNIYLLHVIFPYIDSVTLQNHFQKYINILHVVITKGAFNKNKILVTSKFYLKLRKKLITCYSCSITFYKAVTWTLQKLDQKCLERF